MSLADPAPRLEAVPQDDESSAAITWQDMWILADIECVRAEGTRDCMIAQANASDQQDEQQRAMARRIAADRGRAARIFEKIRWLIDRAASDPEITERLRDLKRVERREAAERTADNASPQSEGNEAQ